MRSYRRAESTFEGAKRCVFMVYPGTAWTARASSCFSVGIERTTSPASALVMQLSRSDTATY